MTGQTITYSKVKDRKNVVQYFYDKESEEWHRQIHKRGGSKEENIKDTLGTISKDSVMYEVLVNGDRAAFFVKYVDENGMAVEGFHIKSEYRQKEFIKRFWEIVKDVFGGSFSIGIYKRNIPAINHLMKQGFLPIKDVVHNGKIFVILKYTIKN